MNARRIATLLAVLVGGGAGCTYSADQPHLAGQDVRLTVLHTSDIHSRIFPYQFAPGQIDKGLGLVPRYRDIAIVGGAARMATVFARERATATRSLHIDSGDIFQGAPVFNRFKGEVEMRVMTQLGLSAMALGNHEFDAGVTNLVLQKAQYGGFQILAANYLFTDPNEPSQPKIRRAVSPWKVVNVAGLRVGIIGMGNLSSLNSIVEGGNSLGIRPLKIDDVMREAVRVLRPQVDLLVVTSHMGLEEDEVLTMTSGNAAQDADENQAAAIEGVDVIFGGHLHISLNPPKQLDVKNARGEVTGSAILVHSGAFAKYVGRLDLVVHVADPAGTQEDDRRTYVKAYTYKLIPIDDTIPPDAEMQNLLEPYQLKMNLALDLQRNYAVVPCRSDASACSKLQRTDPDGGDSQLGNLVATAMRLRKRVEADFALTNSLGIRADFESGPLNLEQMFNVFPFDNFITTMYLSGTEIRDLLDYVAGRSGSRGCKSQAQVSGIWFLMDCAQGIACGPYDAAGNRATHCNRDQRSLDGPPLLGDFCIYEPGSTQRVAQTDPGRCTRAIPTGEYRVAVNDYIANGGSGFIMLKRNTTKFNTGISLRDALIDYIKALPDRCDDPTLYQNIVYDAQDRSEPVRACTAGADQRTIDEQCGGGHVCPTGSCFRHHDFRHLPCLHGGIQAHDGRIDHNR